MILRKSGILQQTRKPVMFRRFLAALAGLLGLVALSASMPASAQPVHFRYTGGHWSHYRHSGWNRYWGGPSVGFYYAPDPVYVVPGYDDPSYYTGSDFWYSNPSFGLSVNVGGGGHNYRREGGRRWRDNGHYRRDNNGRYNRDQRDPNHR